VSVFDYAQNVQSYEMWFEKYPHVFQSEIAALKELLPHGTGFEVGIGTGLFAEKLGILMGNDPSDEMLKIARKRRRLVYHCEGDSLPFHDGYFDYTLMVTTICFLDDPGPVLCECYRVTGNKGSIVIGFVDSESPIGTSYRNHASRSIFYREATFYSTNQVTEMLVQTGFAVEGIRQTLFGPLTAIAEFQPPREGFGEGAFVVVRAVKV
jgi:SAM-dependent methyltransferase